MAKGYIRIIEAVVLIIVLFSLMGFIMENNVMVPSNPDNPPTLMRYARDLASAVCNSDKDRALIASGNLTQVYSDLVYMTPPDMHVAIVVGSERVGDSAPNTGVVYSYSCVVSKFDSGPSVVNVQVWV